MRFLGTIADDLRLQGRDADLQGHAALVLWQQVGLAFRRLTFHAGTPYPSVGVGFGLTHSAHPLLCRDGLNTKRPRVNGELPPTSTLVIL